MTMKDENALIARASEFAIATRMDSIQEVLEANLGGEMINQFSLDRVKIPAGGGTIWEIPTLMGDEASPSLEGVIVAWKTVRAYYDKPFEGGSEPQYAPLTTEGPWHFFGRKPPSPTSAGLAPESVGQCG